MTFSELKKSIENLKKQQNNVQQTPMTNKSSHKPPLVEKQIEIPKTSYVMKDKINNLIMQSSNST